MTFKARPAAIQSTKGKVLESKKIDTRAPTRPVLKKVNEAEPSESTLKGEFTDRCPDCKGKGKVSGKKCEACNGTGHKKSKKAKMKEMRIAYLLENEFEKVENVVAAKGITTALQDFAEKLSSIEAKDIMPVLDSFRDTFGPQATDQFSQVATAKIRELIGATQSAKNAIDGEISRLQQIATGGDSSDVALGGGDVPPPALGGEMPPDVGAAAMPPAADGLPPGDPAGAPSPDIGEIESAEGDPAIGATGFAGRPKKESAKFNKKGNRLTEENAAEDSAFKEDLNKLSMLSPKCYVYAHDILDSIHDLSVGGDMRNKLMKALGHVVSMSQSPDVWDDPESVSKLAVATHLVDVPADELARTPEVSAILKNMLEFSFMVKMKHGGDLNEDDVQSPSATLPAPAPPLPASPLAAPARSSSSPLAAPARASPSLLTAGRVFESRRAKNVKRLRESRNPDKMILTVFRNVFRECADVFKAVHGTARAFSIDAIDVVSIIREAKSPADRRREAEEEKKDKDKAKAKVAAKTKAKTKGEVDEEAVPSLMGVPMGQSQAGTGDQNPNPALMAQNPTAANPVPGQPNKPMTPADMRTAKVAVDAADKVAKANNTPNAPITPPKTMAPVQQVKPGQQQVQPVAAPMSPQMQQQQRANQAGQGKQAKPLPNMPGRAVNNSNMRTM
jgi:hypothetical protein